MDPSPRGHQPFRRDGRRTIPGLFIVFTLIGTLLLYAILRFQYILPWFFPQYQTTPLTPDLSFNTAISFSTTTTWQAYAGENTMSYFSQMVGLCTQNSSLGQRDWQWASPSFEGWHGNNARLLAFLG